MLSTTRPASASARHPWRASAPGSSTVLAIVAVIIPVGASRPRVLPPTTPSRNAQTTLGLRRSRPIGRRPPTSSSFAPTHTRSTRSVSFRGADFVDDGEITALRRARTYLDKPSAGLVSEDRHATIVPVALLDDDETEALVEKVEAIDEDGAFAVSVTGEETLDYDFNSSHKRTWRTGSSSSVSRPRSSSCCSSSARSSPGSCRC